MTLCDFLASKPLFYEVIDVERFPKITATIKEFLPLPKIIHIVGTNGKGSTGRFLATALHRAGYSVGHYTSPHILRFNERIWRDGAEVSDALLENAHQKLLLLLEDDHREALSYFEYTTLLAMVVYEGCAYVVLEAGLGGEFDATNVFAKALSIFTPIDFDHAAFLGSTIESIATTKLRSMETKALLGKQPHIQTKIIARQIATEKGCTMLCIDGMATQTIQSLAQKLALKNHLSDYLRENLELAMAAFEVLGHEVTQERFDQNALFGRLTPLAPNITLDVGHNALAAEAIVRSYVGKKVTLIYNTYADKDYREILTLLRPIIASVEIIDVDESRIVPREALETVLDELEIPFNSFKTIDKEKEYLVFGSFSVAEAFLNHSTLFHTVKEKK
jgi:dihydrofolate synthase/folylpolyglutamate synthase